MDALCPLTTAAAAPLLSVLPQQQPQQQQLLKVHCTAKKGHHNRWFDAYASRLVSPLFKQAFGVPATKGMVRGLGIRFVVTLVVAVPEKAPSDAAAAATAVVVAAVLVEQKFHGVVKLHGVCVDARHRGRGFGTQLMESLETVLPPDTTAVLELCIDAEKEDQLRGWYERLGFKETADSGVDGGEIRMRRRSRLISDDPSFLPFSFYATKS